MTVTRTAPSRCDIIPNIEKSRTKVAPQKPSKIKGCRAQVRKCDGATKKYTPYIGYIERML